MMSRENDAERSGVASNATWSHSLRSADVSVGKSLILEAVAKTMVKQAEAHRMEKSSNCNVESCQSMG
jgi:hypothetical protein